MCKNMTEKDLITDTKSYLLSINTGYSDKRTTRYIHRVLIPDWPDLSLFMLADMLLNEPGLTFSADGDIKLQWFIRSKYETNTNYMTHVFNFSEHSPNMINFLHEKTTIFPHFHLHAYTDLHSYPRHSDTDNYHIFNTMDTDHEDLLLLKMTTDICSVLYRDPTTTCIILTEPGNVLEYGLSELFSDFQKANIIVLTTKDQDYKMHLIEACI